MVTLTVPVHAPEPDCQVDGIHKRCVVVLLGFLLCHLEVLGLYRPPFGEPLLSIGPFDVFPDPSRMPD